MDDYPTTNNDQIETHFREDPRPKKSGKWVESRGGGTVEGEEDPTKASKAPTNESERRQTQRGISEDSVFRGCPANALRCKACLYSCHSSFSE